MGLYIFYSYISLELPGLAKLPSQCCSDGMSNSGDLGNCKDIQPLLQLHFGLLVCMMIIIMKDLLLGKLSVVVS